MSGTDLIVNGVLIVNENFQSGQMGIQLRDVSPIPSDTGLPAGPFGHVLVGDGEDETLIATHPYSYAMYGNEGNDVLTSQVPSTHDSFSDLRDGGAGDDILVGAGGMIISLAVAVMIMPMSPMEISFSVEMAMTLL